MKNSSVFRADIPRTMLPSNSLIKIFHSFEKQQFTQGVFNDFSKTFDKVDYSNLLKKLKLYGITDKNHLCFESYLSNKKQYTEISENSKTSLKYITCGVSQISILGALLFLVYVNNLPNASDLLDPIMFAHDTNLSLIIRTLNTSLQLFDWFTANKLYLNVEKTKYSFSHNPNKKDIFLFAYQNL